MLLITAVEQNDSVIYTHIHMYIHIHSFLYSFSLCFITGY